MAQSPIQPLFNLALQHHQAGRLSEAESLYRQILAQQPQHSGAMHHLGVIAHQAGKYAIALDLIRRAILLRPNYPQAHNDLGNALKDSGQLDAAIVVFRQAIALRPDYAEAYYNLGLVLYAQGKLDEAIAANRQAIALRPNFADAHINLGVGLKDQGRIDEAISSYRRAIALNPGLPHAHNNLGTVLNAKGQLHEAIAACRQAIALRPDYLEAWYNLANALTDQGLLDEAVTTYRRAITLRPNDANVHNNLGNALKDQGRLDEAIAAYRQAVAIDPVNSARDGNLIYLLQFHAGFGPAEIFARQRDWEQKHAAPLASLIRPHTNNADPNRRIRIGYVSPDLRHHVVGTNLLPLLREHDHSKFEIYCYASVATPDSMSERLKAFTDGWRDISKMSDQQAADLIREDQIDIAVDLTLYMAENRLLVFARKPAPVQVSYLGYCGGTGLKTIDYRISDPNMDPSDEDLKYYSEETVRLPNSYWCYQRPDPSPPIQPPPVLKNGYITFGCLNNFAKVSPGTLDVWAKILASVPKSRIIIHSLPGGHVDAARARFTSIGIEKDRVEFVGKQAFWQYLRCYNQIDIALDPFPYGGGITTCDGLWMGAMAITLSGQTAVGRGGRSILTNIGLPQWVAYSTEEYVQLAVNLASDVERLRQMRLTIRERMLKSPLMDAKQFARDVEAAYRRMWQMWALSHSGEETNR